MRIEFNKTLAFTSEVEGGQTLRKEWPDGRRPGGVVTEAKEREGSKMEEGVNWAKHRGN